MSFTVELKGDKELVAELRKFGRKAEDGLGDVINATGLELRTQIIKGYNEGGKVGIVYQKYNPRRTHQASEEGQAPATDEGTLWKSVTLKRIGPASVEVFSNLQKPNYGAMLEWGTQDIAPRPLWRPEAEKMRPKYNKRLRKLLGRLIDGANR